MPGRRHAILEIEEGALSLTVASQVGGTLHIDQCQRVLRPDTEPETLSSAIGELLRAVDTEVRQVHVLLGDRRFLHFRIEVPRMRPDELRAFVQRECLRIGSLAADVRVNGHCQRLRRLSNGNYRFAVVALPSRAWQQLQPALDRNGLEVLTLTSIEEGMRAVLPANAPDIAALLDVSGNRARFVHTEHGAVTQVRRFLLPTMSNDREAADPMLAAHLAIEIPRTLDYLAEIEHPLPRALFVGPRTPIAETDLDTLAGDIPVCERLPLPFGIADHQAPPSLATVGRLLAVQSRRPRSALEGMHVEAPRSPVPLLAALGAAAAGLAVATQVSPLRERNAQLEAEAAATAQTLLELGQQETELLADRDPTPPLADEQLDSVLRRRRPASLLLASVCNAAPAGIALTELAYSNAGEIIVRGRTTEPSRLLSLQMIADFAEGLGRVSCLANGSEDIVSDNDTTGVAFAVRFGWRQP